MTSTWHPRVLVADDEEIQRNILKEILSSAGCATEAAGSVEQALDLFRRAARRAQPFDLVLSDLKMPAGLEGLDLLTTVKEESPQTEVILMTAYSTVQSAVKAMKLGAFEYLPKPFDKNELLHVVELASEKLKLLHENRQLRRMVEAGEGLGRMIGAAPAMKELFRLIERVARTASNCLVRGESGTGKELVARALHYGGPRAAQPFIAINCAAIPDALIESELFGHEKGVFTGATSQKNGRFEEVGEGTLFLDEIGSMKVDLQAKLLRVIQEREFSRVGSSRLIPFAGRVVAATAQDLEQACANGDFREDLYFRLNVVMLSIPPLRDRLEDLPLLVDRFLSRCAERLGCTPRRPTSAVLAAFERHRWPGNVRELENCIERMMVLAESDTLDVDLLPPTIRNPRPIGVSAAKSPSASGSALTLAREAGAAIADPEGSVGHGGIQLPRGGVVLEELESQLIRQALERTDGRLEPAAQLLGITYKTLQYRIKKYELKESDESARDGKLPA
ncbi:MAG: sigma-54-dependent transcriptional regulator [Planctomycetota bacterium]